LGSYLLNGPVIVRVSSGADETLALGFRRLLGQTFEIGKQPGMSASRYFDISHTGDVTVLTPHLRLSDLREINDFQNELLDFVDHYKPTKLAVDFHEVARTSSWFIGTMLRLDRRVKSHGGQLRLCNMNRVVREVFHITALDRKGFRILNTMDEVLADFSVAVVARTAS
jgi:anti-anti-sigma factor